MRLLIPFALASILFYTVGLYNLVEEFVLLPSGQREVVKGVLVFGGVATMVVGFILSQWELRLLEEWQIRIRRRFRVLQEFTAESISITDLDGVCTALVRAVQRLLGVSQVWVLLLDADKGRYEGHQEGARSLSLKMDGAAVRVVEQRGSMAMADLETGGQEILGEVQDLVQAGVILLAPVRTRERLTAVLAVGPKSSGQPFGRGDMQALSAVAMEAGVALENARLFALEHRRAAQLQELDRQKTDFLATVSHQLKTPVTSIKVALGLLVEEVTTTSGSPVERLLTSASHGVEALEKLVEDLLDFVRVRSARMELVLESVALDEVVQGAVYVVTPLARAKEQELLVQVPRGMPPVEADKKRLVQVLLNLLSNASQYSVVGQPITVTVERRDQYAVVSVRDKCGGIAPGDLSWIFDAYYRSQQTSPASAPTGSGLGLAIAKGLVELHGGKIWVDSVPGDGCTFSFSLPLERAGDADP